MWGAHNDGAATYNGIPPCHNNMMRSPYNMAKSDNGEASSHNDMPPSHNGIPPCHNNMLLIHNDMSPSHNNIPPGDNDMCRRLRSRAIFIAWIVEKGKGLLVG